MSRSCIVAALGLSSFASSTSLFARNNPPQPPCSYPYTDFVYSGCFYDAVYNRSLPFQTELDWTNATIQQCTAYCKGNNYRYAGLEYYGQCFCGASVSSAAAPAEDCNLPCNGDPTQACGGQDRISIYQDPTFPDADDIAISSDYLSLGCYTEGTSGRSLDYSQWDFLNISTMTTETCLNTCGSKGYPFAGTEYGQECYCGVVLGNGTTQDDGQCTTPCTGNSTEFCGGPNHLSLYVAKNLESTEPCGPPVLSSSSAIPTSTSTSASSSSRSSSSSSTRSLSTTSSSLSKTTPKSTVSSTSTHSSSSAAKSSTKGCIGYFCPPPPPSTPCKTPTPSHKSSSSTHKSTVKTTSTSTKKSSTLKTTTTYTSSAKATSKSTAKSSSSTQGYGHGW